jgi:glyoxylase-like metal-dependent hydrolase (beta-lactamase superfamily II)
MSWSRRDFMKVSALGLAGSALAGPSSLLGRTRAEFVPLRRNVGIFTERGGTVGWLMNADGVAIVDSQFADTAPLLLEGVRARTTLPIDVLINSHHHPDHIGGNAVLRPAVGRIVAHERSLENQRRVAGRASTPPDEGAFPDTTYTDETSLSIGDETIHLKHYGPAHTGGDSAIYFEQANVVHLGDLLNNHGWPNIDAGAGGTVHGWVRVIETFLPVYPADAIYIFGHNEAGAPPTGSREDVSFQRDYFLAVIEIAERALAVGRSREEAIALTALPGFEFGGTPSRLPLAVGIAYDELAAMRR